MNTEKWTASRVLVIKYDRDGRYHERLFRRTVLNNAFPVYIDPAGDRFEKTLLTTYPKAYPIPDDAELYRWVLKTAPWSLPPMVFRSPIAKYLVRSMDTTCSFPCRTSPT